MIFQDRKQAGEQLAGQLGEYSGEDLVVVAIPRGGVVVGREIAKVLNAPLDIIIPRKIGAPGNQEFAIGAICSHGQVFLDEKIIDQYKIPKDYLNAEIGRQGLEIERRERAYRQNGDPLSLRNKTVILVDDGIATGATTKVAIKSIKCQEPKKIILAVPVAPRDKLSDLEKEVDEVICLATPEPFYAIGQFYQEFDQTTDEEVVQSLQRGV